MRRDSVARLYVLWVKRRSTLSPPARNVMCGDEMFFGDCRMLMEWKWEMSESEREWMLVNMSSCLTFIFESLTSWNVKLNKLKYRYFGTDISVLEYLLPLY